MIRCPQKNKPLDFVRILSFTSCHKMLCSLGTFYYHFFLISVTDCSLFQRRGRKTCSVTLLLGLYKINTTFVNFPLFIKVYFLISSLVNLSDLRLTF